MSSGLNDGATLGIDEAGRGPVLGPLVVAAVALRPQRAAALTRRGVCDSKLFGAGPEACERRAELAEHIHGLADFVGIEVFDHLEVDRYVSLGRLNDLERKAARSLIAAAQPMRRMVADGLQVFGPLRHEYPQLEVFDDGESAHVSVAAASIVAKDRRDRLFAEIAARYRDEFGELRGGGYVNSATADFLRRYHERYGCFPSETRRTWACKVLLELEPLQLSLLDPPVPPPGSSRLKSKAR
jgi:ribonuclease HII